MVYKIGNLADVKKLTDISMDVWQLLYHHARVLSTEYGEDRNIDNDDGGFVLYCTPGTKGEDIKACFDYTKHTMESIDRHGQLYAAIYILTNEFAVTIVGSIVDAPHQFINEIN